MSALPPVYPTTGAASAAAAAASSTAMATAASPATSAAGGGGQPISFPAWDAPPQASYGWFVDVPPPRGPYLWPALPETYKLRATPASSSAEEKSAAGLTAGGESTNESLFQYAPQLVWGWFCAVPPPQPPFLWPAIPEGYVLVRADEVDAVPGSPPPVAAAAATAASPSPPPSSMQRQPSQVTANPLAAVSTLPRPTAIPTQLPMSVPPMLPPMMMSPFLSPSSFLAPTSATSNSPMTSVNSSQEASQPMDTSDGPTPTAKAKRGRAKK